MYVHIWMCTCAYVLEGRERIREREERGRERSREEGERTTVTWHVHVHHAYTVAPTSLVFNTVATTYTHTHPLSS